MATQFASIAVQGLQSFSVSSQGTVTTTSNTPSLLGSMTLTPIAGTYLAHFDTYVQSTAGGNSITVGLYVGGTLNSNSPRTVQFPTATLIDSGYPFYVGIQGQVITANGAQAVTIEWNTNGGTASCFNRTLTLLKIG